MIDCAETLRLACFLFTSIWQDWLILLCRLSFVVYEHVGAYNTIQYSTIQYNTIPLYWSLTGNCYSACLLAVSCMHIFIKLQTILLYIQNNCTCSLIVVCVCACVCVYLCVCEHIKGWDKVFFCQPFFQVFDILLCVQAEELRRVSVTHPGKRCCRGIESALCWTRCTSVASPRPCPPTFPVLFCSEMPATRTPLRPTLLILFDYNWQGSLN